MENPGVRKGWSLLSGYQNHLVLLLRLLPQLLRPLLLQMLLALLYQASLALLGVRLRSAVHRNPFQLQARGQQDRWRRCRPISQPMCTCQARRCRRGLSKGLGPSEGKAPYSRCVEWPTVIVWLWRMRKARRPSILRWSLHGFAESLTFYY